MDTLILDNPLTAWLTAIALAGVTWATLDFARRKGMARIEKLAGTTSTALDDALVGALAATKWWFYMWLSVFVGAYALDLETRHAEMLEGIATIAVLIQAAVWLLAALAAWLRVYAEHQAEDGHTFRLGGTILFVAKLVTWTVFSLLLLENLGVDVSALVAGFGVGGIAVALAVQNILGDLFASLSIALDQPFVQGDFIIVGEHSGTVVQTGLKTTRLKSISGEQLVFSNTDLLDARIRNYGRMDERRVVFQLGVEYDTSR
ncbi:MAG: small-conductance mechanosensitive channel, partial [Myxococcota bacterium]